MDAENKDLKLPKKLGAPRKIETPDLLWDLAQQYFEYTDANPWIKKELIKSGDLAGVIVDVPCQRPYTWSGLEIFVLMKGYNTRLDEYKSNRRGGFADFADVVKKITSTLYQQKFDGATVGSFNSNIIQRDLGLAEKTVVETRDTTDKFNYEDLSESALEEIAKARQKVKDDEDDLS